MGAELTLDAANRALLDPERGSLAAPLRDDAAAQLLPGARGARLAASFGPVTDALPAAPFLPRLRANVRALHEAHRCIARQAQRGHAVGAAGEWLLDNIHVLAAQTREVHDGLPRGFFRRLPVLAGGGNRGLPRVFALVWAFVAEEDSAFDTTTLAAYLHGFQQDPAHTLTLGELWALPTTLRVVLIENLRRLAERVATEEAAREAANALCADPAQHSAREAAELFERMQRRGVGAAFALQVMVRLHDDPDAGTPQGRQGRERVRAALAAALPDPGAALRLQQASFEADNRSVAQAVRALQALGHADWRRLVAQTSALMRTLARAPGFAAEREDTQDITLHAVERLARRCGRSEPEVAAVLLRLMQQALPPGDGGPAGPGAEAAGHWAHGPGRPGLERALGLHDSGWRVAAASAARHALPLYLGALAAGTAAVTAGFMATAGLPGTPGWLLAVAAGLALLPASEAAGALLHRLLGEWLPPRRASRLALADGLPADQSVLVVVPAMLTSSAGIQALVARLEQHHLANREAHTQFALLSDWADAVTATRPEDAALLAEARAAIEALELRHRGGGSAPGGPRRFLLLHRTRRWSDSEQRWIGWERKRGKLEQLVALLAQPSSHPPAPSPFIDLGACSQPRRPTTHVLTLDSDTTLPPGALRELVGVAAHPLNQPQVDTLSRRVVAGHAILQPRVDIAWPRPAEATPFHRLFAGVWGHDPYHAASSEVYNDCFDEASFSGKGLLHVAAVHAVLGGRLPEGQILSHDLVEGAIARCGGVSDVRLLEPAPSHPDMASARLHRWTRGDWQLWPLLLHPRRNGLTALNVWKLLDNLRRPLVAPASLALLLLALAGHAVAPLPALLLGLAALATGPILSALAGLAPTRDDIALRHFARVAGGEALRALLGAAWHLAMWPRLALTQLSAVWLALWRNGVSRRLLLQWRTADTPEPGPSGLRHAGYVPAAAGLAVLLLWAGTPAPALVLALCALWAGTPLWIALAGRVWRHAAPRLARSDRRYLYGVAHDTWRFFEQHVGPQTHHLPPDNVQTVPRITVAQRTSPTNIGLYLLSLVTARAFGWIDDRVLLARMEATLDTLERLPRHRGHLLNWIDTHTLQVLPPAYVSVVDSGNLCVHLLAVAAALDGERQQPAHAGRRRSLLLRQDMQHRFATAAARCRTLAEEPAFGFLYDKRRRLFHIGWRVPGEQAGEPAAAGPDPGHYDLLASEARLASLWAIAKGDVPATHWAALGRPLQAEGPHVGLRSWSGSMFEYLMPALVLDEPAGTLLGRAALMAVHEQQRQGARTGLPWGQSECARAEVDASLAYQYGPQGVPRLAMRRTPPDEHVIAPYATALAAMVAPAEAAANLRRLEALGARTRQGFIEALDFSAERRPDPEHLAPVHTAMAHHQGMALVALAVVLLRGLPRRWGMADARLAAVASLLHERIPREVAPVAVALADPVPHGGKPGHASAGPALAPGLDALPPTQLLSNGRYAVALRPGGAGWSRFGGADVTRWRDDALRDAHGSFVFVRRHAGAVPVSVTAQPAADPEAHYEARFGAGSAVFSATWPDLRVLCTVWVDAEADIEFRRIELWNTSPWPIELDLLSAFEVALSPARADEMHPAFANLFVGARWDATTQSLSFTRRPRRDDETALHAAHFVASADAATEPARALADRARWRGRRRGSWQPLAAFEDADAASGERATGLDPVAALAIHTALPPHGRALVVLGTAAATDAAALAALVARGRGSLPAESPPALGVVSPGAEERARLQALATPLLLTLARPAPAGAVACDRRALWRFGVSGERPLISVHIGHPQGLRLVRALVRGLAWWARGGLVVDLVVLNAELPSYQMALQHELLALREQHRTDAAASPTPAGPGALHVWPLAELNEAERASLARLARVRLHADGRPLAQHVAELRAWHEAARAERAGLAGVRLADEAALPAVAATSPEGDFDAEDGSYRFETSLDQPTPRPWVNVLANPAFGALVSEAGAGYSWAGNSRLHQLSAWGNDVLGDMEGETFLVQDLRSRQLWQVGRASTGGGLRDATSGPAGCHVRHGIGSTRIRQWLDSRDRRDRIALTTTWSVDPVLAIKRVHLRLQNAGPRVLELRVVGIVEWVMGSLRGDRSTVATAAVDGRDGGPAVDMLLATQHDGHDGRGGHTASLSVHRSGAAHARFDDWTCDRRDLFDAAGRAMLPDQLGRRCGAGLDPCAAASLHLRLAPGASVDCCFLIGHAATATAAQAQAVVHTVHDASQAAADARAHWQALLGAVRVRTPDPLFDALVNHWLPYQTVACRLWGRAGFYQAGGAYGFRDQLQDTMALAVTAPHLLREQLLRAAAHQFVEGDVLHWWHPGSGAGARTRFSDDRLWLPHALLHHARVTGDTSLLDETAPFIEGDAIAEGAEDSYAVPRTSSDSGTLYEHGARAIDRSLAVGAHGLPLIGGGDWNDGMNRVGHGGRGESVWLAWFLCPIVAGFVPLAQARGEVERAARWQAAARGWRQALGLQAWDGLWFRRAYFDDGTPLGAASGSECRIDLIAQAWSVLSGAASLARQHQAMASAQLLLGDEPLGLLKLLDPPLAQAVPAAGYIQAYPPGVRENGGQYAHAAAWAVMAQARLGDAEAAWRTWAGLSPAHRAAHPLRGPLYGLEPYVMAADICSQPPYAGRGGWSWYTGSAGVMHRAALESICGLEVAGTRLRLRPHLPQHWPGATVELRLAGRELQLQLCAAGHVADAAALIGNGAIPLAAGHWLDAGMLAPGLRHRFVCLLDEPGTAVYASAQTRPDTATTLRTVP